MKGHGQSGYKLGTVSEQDIHTNKKTQTKEDLLNTSKEVLLFLPLRDQGIICVLLAVWQSPFSPKMFFVPRLVGNETQVHLCGQWPVSACVHCRERPWARSSCPCPTCLLNAHEWCPFGSCQRVLVETLVSSLLELSFLQELTRNGRQSFTLWFLSLPFTPKGSWSLKGLNRLHYRLS